MFTARYALHPCITQVRCVFKGLNQSSAGTGDGGGYVDWVYVVGVWSIGVLIYATVLNSQSHLVDGYGSVCQCMGFHRLVGEELRAWLCVIFSQFLFSSCTLSAHLHCHPPGRPVVWPQIYFRIALRSVLTRPWLRIPWNTKECLYQLWGIFSQEAYLAEPSKTDGIAVLRRSNSECLAWRPCSPSSSSFTRR